VLPVDEDRPLPGDDLCFHGSGGRDERCQHDRRSA
jgi:hypothetical protein